MFNDKKFIEKLIESLKDKYSLDKTIDTQRVLDEVYEMSRCPGMLEKFYELIKSKNKGNKNSVNSYLAYLYGITTKKPDGPFKPKLDFELARVSHPDIDIDFDFFHRDETYSYLIERYGREYTSNIGTYQRFKAKNAIRKSIKALDPFDDKIKSLEFENYVAELIPNGPGITLETAIKENSELSKLEKQYPEVFEIAGVIEGLACAQSRHAAGLVVSDVKIQEVAPLHRLKDGSYATQFEMAELEDLGLIKFDILALKTLSYFDMVEKDLKDDLDIDFNVNTIPLNDPKALNLIAKGLTDSVFQLEGGGMKELLKNMKVNVFDDVAASNALYRPGAMAAEAHLKYCDCKHGKIGVTYEHPKLEPILSSTYGQLIYQEQCQLAVMELAGFKRKEADKLRKAIGKKQGDLFIALKKKFIIGAMEHSNMDSKTASRFFKKIEDMGGYAFCRAHAYAYGVLAMQTAYLKAHYPLYYMKAVLNTETLDGKLESVERYMKDCIRLRIQMFPCNINKSKALFTVEGKGLRIGIASLKGVGMKASSEIEELAKFKDFEDFVDRTLDKSVINKKVVEVLMHNGVFADFNLQDEEGLEEFLKVRKHVDYRKRRNIQKSSMFDLSNVSFG